MAVWPLVRDIYQPLNLNFKPLLLTSTLNPQPQYSASYTHWDRHCLWCSPHVMTVLAVSAAHLGLLLNMSWIMPSHYGQRVWKNETRWLCRLFTASSNLSLFYVLLMLDKQIKHSLTRAVWSLWCGDNCISAWTWHFTLTQNTWGRNNKHEYPNAVL